MLIKLAYLESDWKEGIKTPVIWNTEQCPHICIAGTTGGGKTVLTQLIYNQLLDSDAYVAICDFKSGGEWNDVANDYAEYLQCDDLLDRFYERFTQTIKDRGKTNAFLIFDEFNSYMLFKNSKDFKETMTKVGHIAFMGRSFGVHLIIVSQQISSKVLDTAIREQFGIKVFMGNISTESQVMLFPNTGIDKSVHLPRFCGYISTPEIDLDVVRLPYLENPARLKMLLEAKHRIQGGIYHD